MRLCRLCRISDLKLMRRTASCADNDDTKRHGRSAGPSALQPHDENRFVSGRVDRASFGNGFPTCGRIIDSSRAHGVAFLLQAEPLEHRTLLSGSSASQQVAIQVPSAYISQQADQLTVTLVRSGAAGDNRSLGPLTVDFSATQGSLPAGGTLERDNTRPAQFTPVNESVTFPPG